MEYVTTAVRFLFFDGKKRYTVEYCYGISKWFVFNEDETRNAVYIKEDKKIKFNSVNKSSAEDILYEFLETISPTCQQQIQDISYS